jgi:hypothetical protein
MKKIFSFVLVFAVAATVSFSSFASVSAKKDKDRKSAREAKKAAVFFKKNADDWSTFKDVVLTYKVSNGKFQNMTKAEQADFFAAAETLKSNLAKAKGNGAVAFVKQVDLAEDMFRFIWNSKPEYVEIEEAIQAPTLIIAPVLG